MGGADELDREFDNTALRVCGICIAANGALFLLKLAGGIFGRSRALISDAVNSAFDVLSGFVVLAGARYSRKNSDREHPYGHERFESVSVLVLSVMLLIAVVFTGHTAIEEIIGGGYKTAALPGKLSVLAALLSMAVKELMYRYTKVNAEKIDSSALRAEAMDHRTDVIGTAGALGGVLASRLGFSAGDIIASLFVCLLIFRTAIISFRDAIGQMVDRSCSEEELQKMREVIASEPGVLGIDRLRVRVFGNRLYVDLEISERGSVSLREAHAVAERVHDRIENDFPAVKHIMVHVNPAEEER